MKRRCSILQRQSAGVSSAVCLFSGLFLHQLRPPRRGGFRFQGRNGLISPSAGSPVLKLNDQRPHSRDRRRLSKQSLIADLLSGRRNQPAPGVWGLARETVALGGVFCRRSERGFLGGFSGIRNAEQLGPHKRIIYTEAGKGEGKLSSFSPAHTDKYKCTHEATLARSRM